MIARLALKLVILEAILVTAALCFPVSERDKRLDSTISMEGESGESKSSQRRVGLLYDERMCKHHTPDGVYHPENPNRIRAIWNKLQEAAIPQRCVVLNAKEAEDNYLLSVHTKNHVNLIRNVSSNEFDLQRNFIASKFNSIYLNEGSSEAAYLAAGSVIEVAERVAKGELNSAFAVVRPPGHHAEEDEAMGFCLYNNVATAASFLLNERPELGINKILIVDWDVHHGNGTQKMFWKDNRVIFFSVHRHDFGIFYPANDDGFYTMIGEGPGTGYNINVPWENGRCGDADYLAVWDHILLPVAKDFRPDIIIISAGFDAAAGDPLGGCRVTPYGYSIMLKKLMDFAQGKIVLVLEGGYNLESLSNSVLGCMKVLLEDQPVAGSSEAYPFESTWRVIQAVRHELSAFWPTLADELPAKLTGLKAPPSHTILSSDSEDEDRRSEEIESVREDVIERLSKLQVENGQSQLGTAASWRPEFSKIDVWYATFGSNMWKRRFFRYIEGGQVEGMQKLSTGSKDKTLPKPENILWKTYPHRLFFGRESSRTWGRGGTAFLNPKSSNQDQVHLLLYKITLEQFNDVLFQENGLDIDSPSPLFDLSHLNTVVNENFLTLEAIEKGLYNTVLYLGKEQDLPIMTMTCSVSVFNKFKSGELPMVGAAVTYANILKRGLVEGELLSNEEAEAYIHEASTKPL